MMVRGGREIYVVGVQQMEMVDVFKAKVQGAYCTKLINCILLLCLTHVYF